MEEEEGERKLKEMEKERRGKEDYSREKKEYRDV